MLAVRETRIYKLLRRIPLPLLAVLAGLVCGSVVWIVLDKIQSRAIEQIFSKELELQLDQRARESLIRFERYVSNFSSTTRLLAKHRRLSQYLEPLAWFYDDDIAPIIYRQAPPFWYPQSRDLQALAEPSHVLLLDLQGRTREILQVKDVGLQVETLLSIDELYLSESRHQAYLARLDDKPFLLVSELVEDSGGFAMGSLMMIVPVDEQFLAASQQGMQGSSAVVAIVDADAQQVLSSSNRARLFPGTSMPALAADYEVTSQSFAIFDSTDLNVQFATFVPREGVQATARNILVMERRQRLIEAGVFVGVFTFVFYLVSELISRTLRRISAFAQRALGIDQPVAIHGNQLLMLEDWIRHFIQLVRHAREEMRIQHESEMRETEAIKRAILETSMDSIIGIDTSGSIIEFNPTAEKAFGYSRESVIGKRLGMLLIAEQDRRQFKSMVDTCGLEKMDSGGYTRGELMAVRADHSSFPAEVSIMPVLLGPETLYTVYMHDISKRRKAKRDIESLAKFASESPSPVLRINDRGVIVYANAASDPLLKYWGCGRAQTLPLNWRNRALNSLETGRNVEIEVNIGGKIFSLLFAPIEGLDYVNIYGRDITEVRNAEQQSRQHQSELVHVCRLSTMGEMATGLAHELNQPLSAIVNYANGCSRRLQKCKKCGVELVHAMDQITGQAERAGEIIKRLRSLVGKQLPVRSKVDLNDLVREVVLFVEFEVRKLDLDIDLQLTQEALPVRVDLVQIEQVLLNLVRNALDVLEERPVKQRKLIIRTRNLPDDMVQVEVEDSGRGIDSATMDQLFDAFFTTKIGGMGMGLPISKTIIEDHNGKIWAKSKPGTGTTFYVLLPTALEFGGTQEMTGMLQ